MSGSTSTVTAPGEQGPIIHLINGNDEFAITQYLAKIQSELGEPSLVAMNLTRLDGRTSNPDDLLLVAGSMPFMISRRLVILEHPSARINSSEAQKKFLASLAKIAPTTVLALVEYRILTEKKKRHWLEEWAFAAGERVRIKRFDLPRSEDMPRWIMDKAKSYTGRFTRDAAVELASLVGDEPRQVDQEILKLLTYVNYRRPVEIDDVRHLTSDTREGYIFILVDALGNRNIHSAMETLHRLLEQDEPISIFAMIVRQFRLLLQARELLDRGSRPPDVATEMRIQQFVAEKISAQSRRFSLPVLELIYRRLLDVDLAMKTSQMPGDLALETLVVALGDLDPVNANPEMVG